MNIYLAHQINKAASKLNITNVQVEKSSGWQCRTRYTCNLPRQQLKLVAALADSTPSTASKYLEYLPQYIESKGDYSVFASLIAKQNQASGSVENAFELLGL